MAKYRIVKYNSIQWDDVKDEPFLWETFRVEKRIFFFWWKLEKAFLSEEKARFYLIFLKNKPTEICI